MDRTKRIFFFLAVPFCLLLFISKPNAIIRQCVNCGDNLNQATKNASINYLKASSFAFNMLSAVEQNKLDEASNLGGDAIRYLEAARKHFSEASRLSKDLKKVDKWLIGNMRKVKERLKIPPSDHIWQSVSEAAEKRGAEGLMTMSISSTKMLEGVTAAIVNRTKMEQIPPYEELLRTIHVYNTELRKGILISDILYVPHQR